MARLVAFLAVVTAVFLFAEVRMALRARRAPIVSGLTTMVGADGENARGLRRNRLGEHSWRRRGRFAPLVTWRAGKGFASSISTARYRAWPPPKESEMAWASPLIVLICWALLVGSSPAHPARSTNVASCFSLAGFWRVKGPGLVILVPGIQQMVKVDLRTVVFEVPTQDVISRDNVSVKVSAVVYLRVIDAEKAIIQV